MRLVLLGPPGCGKGTQAELLSAKLGVPAIATGDMLRAAVAAGSDLGERVEAVMAAGALVDDELMAQVVKDRLAEPDAQDGFLLDGYPRTPPQAETLNTILRDRSQQLDHVVLIEVPEEVLVQRAVARQRVDDKEEVVRERQRVYLEKTAPLVDYYDRNGLLRKIDGNQSIEAVSHSLASAVGSSP